jgi:dephospho-CoA kinase
MKVIGLTGGIASGKSTVSGMLKKLGAEIIDADKIAREVVEPGQKCLNMIVTKFGKGVLKSDGTLDRKKLGSIVFNDKRKLKFLNDITHPEIRKIIGQRLKTIEMNGKSDAVVVDAAVLIESRMDDMVDEVWLVYVDDDIQLERLKKRDNITDEEAAVRISSQMPFSQKMKHADCIIDNSKTIEHTKEQVEKLWDELFQKKSR